MGRRWRQARDKHQKSTSSVAVGRQGQNHRPPCEGRQELPSLFLSGQIAGANQAQGTFRARAPISPSEEEEGCPGPQGGVVEVK